MDVARLLLLGLVLTLPGSARAASWSLEDGSAIRFEAYQQGAPVAGGFDRFTASIDFDPDDLASSRVEVEIGTASVHTGHKDRDTLLRSPNLLDVEQWPTARFASTRFEHLEGDAYRAYGRLTLRGVQKDVVLPFTLNIDGDAAHAAGQLTISRLDYGVGQGEWASTATIGENVKVAIEIVAAAKR